MKSPRIIVLLFASTVVASLSAAQTLEWHSIENLSPNTRIWVKTKKQTYCYFEKATGEQLLCDFLPGSLPSKAHAPDLVFNRADVREVRIAPGDDYDSSKGFLSLILAAGGGGGWDFAHQPNAFAGVKVGGPVSLDLQYDRIEGHSGFSTEGSAVIPLFRIPRYQPFSTRKFVKLYAEPGLGYELVLAHSEATAVRRCWLRFSRIRGPTTGSRRTSNSSGAFPLTYPPKATIVFRLG